MPTFVLTFILAATTTFACLAQNPVSTIEDDAVVADQGEIVEPATQEKVTISAGFENGTLGEQIEGWWNRETDDFRARVSDETPIVGKQCMKLHADKPGKSGFNVLNHSLDPAKYRGKRIRFRAAVRAEVEEGRNQAQLWFRVDRASGIASFDNMGRRPIKNNEWKYYEIVGNVAKDARSVTIGLLLIGKGTAFLDDVSVEVVDENVALTAEDRAPGIETPRRRGTPIGKLGPGLFEVLGSMEVRHRNRQANDGADKESRLLLPLPLSYRDQVPLSYQLTADPPEALKSVNIYEDQPDNFVAEVILTEPAKHKKVELKFRSAVLVRPSDFDHVPKTAPVPETWPEEATPWLASTWCVGSDDGRIQAIAKEIRADSNDVLKIIGRVEEKAREIFGSAEGHVKDLTATEALDKRGSCTSCGNLVAALLRASDVPARVLSGYPSWSGPLQTHYIVEAYVPGYGWYPVESTMCRSPWPNSHQINVAIIPPEYEAQKLARRRRSAAGGVPYLSLTESPENKNQFYTFGNIEGARACDHECRFVRKFDANETDWEKAFAWAKPRWANWLESEQPAKDGTLRFSAAAGDIKSDSPEGLIKELNR